MITIPLCELSSGSWSSHKDVMIRHTHTHTRTHTHFHSKISDMSRTHDDAQQLRIAFFSQDIQPFWFSQIFSPCPLITLYFSLYSLSLFSSLPSSLPHPSFLVSFHFGHLLSPCVIAVPVSEMCSNNSLFFFLFLFLHYHLHVSFFGNTTRAI